MSLAVNQHTQEQVVEMLLAVSPDWYRKTTAALDRLADKR